MLHAYIVVVINRDVVIMLVLMFVASNDVQSHRQRIVKEIFDTEYNYISQLHTIIDVSVADVIIWYHHN